MLHLKPDAPDLDRVLADAANQFGTPAYVYLTDLIEERLALLRSHLGRWFSISYAMKSNPNPALVQWLADRADMIDVSSGGEAAAAIAAGWLPDRISFTGPGKREEEIAAAIEAGVGTLVIESLREARIASRLASSRGIRQEALIRIAPARVPRGFGDQMAGRPCPFGIDVETAPEELAAILALPGLSVTGMHIYSGTQCLKPEAVCENWRIFMEVFRDLAETCDLHPRQLVFGAGLGIPYHAGDSAIDLAAVAEVIGPELDAFRREPRMQGTQLVLELGRYLVGEAGFFVTRVVSLKQSRGHRIAICDGGMNAHNAAAGGFGMVLRRNYVMHRINGAGEGNAEEPVDLVGPLCTSIDRLGSGVSLPRLEEGDLVAIHASGAYGPTASPVRFISHPQPREILVSGAGLADVTPPGWT